jgi:hypothetical protein
MEYQVVTINFKTGDSVSFDEATAFIRQSKELTFYISNRKVVVPLASIIFPLPDSIKVI